MSRSTWKIPHIKLKLEHWALNQVERSEQTGNRKRLTTHHRSATITPLLIAKNIAVHNGKTFINVAITEHHVGFKCGEFVLTKKAKKNVGSKKTVRSK